MGRRSAAFRAFSTRVLRGCGLAVGLAAASPRAPAQGDDLTGQPEISCAGATTTDLATGETVFKPDARFEDGDIVLTADEIRYNSRTGAAVATGKVALTRHADRMTADRLVYQRSNGTFTAINLRAGNFPFYVVGPKAEGTRNEIVIHNATIIYREPGPWQPSVRASTIVYSPGHYLRLGGSYAGVGATHVLPIPKVREDLTKPLSISNVLANVGYKGSLGAYGDLGLHWPLASGVTGGPDLGIYTARGVMAGPLADVSIDNGTTSIQGDLRSGFIHDYGGYKDRLTDVLGDPVPASRGYVDWTEQAQFGQNLTIDSDINWWKDSEILRDFKPKDFIDVQEPDNFVEGTYTGQNTFLSVFTRFQPDAFFPVQQRLPELEFDLVPMALPGGFYQRAESSLVRLQEMPPDGGQDLAATRFDVFYGLTRPFHYHNWLDVTPVVGGRFTDYWSTEGAALPGGAARALGEIGFDADMRTSAIWNYKNALWGIDGLRHLFTPILSYRYIPDAAKDAAEIPQIDRDTFTTEPPILELGDVRSIDQLQAVNVLRFGFNNTLQTHDPTYGSRDLMIFNLTDDLRFQRTAGDTTFSNIRADFGLYPARWLEIAVDDTTSSRTGAQKDLDINVTFRDADLWTMSVGVGYLTEGFGTYTIPDQGTYPITGIDAYHWEGKVRLNEMYQAFARFDYDDRSHVFADQFYGVYQKLGNTWVVQYTLAIYGGPSREHGVGFNVGLELARF